MPLLFVLEGFIVKKYLTELLLAVLGLLLILPMGLNVQAATTTNNVKYSVSPELLGNQIDKTISYYDLKMAPNQKEAIKFKINNNDSQSHNYSVLVNRATTDPNGVIVYNEHGVPADNNLKYNIENLVDYPKEVTVPANSSKEVTINLTMPDGNFKGELLGGIFVEENNQVSKKIVKGVSLKNKYNYVLGLQLQENSDNTKPDLKFIKAYQTTTNTNQIQIDGEMDNDVPRLEKNVSVSAKVTPKNSDKVLLSSSRSNMSMAPNSDFDYPVNVNTEMGTNKNKRLKPGTYTMYLDVKANGGQNLWKLQRNFTITKGQSAKLNKKIPNRSNNLWIILGVLLLIIVNAAAVIRYYRNKRR